MTTCLKNMVHEFNDFTLEEIIYIWDEWSKDSIKYNKSNNMKIWDSLTSNLNFNYIINSYNSKCNTSIELLESIKTYKSITRDLVGIDIIEMNNKYIHDKEYTGVQMTQDKINNYDTIIIKSTTGTGKTSNTAKFIKAFIEQEKSKETVEIYKVLSIVSRISLAGQHVQSFKNENIEILSYLEHDKNIEDDNIVICLNAILLFSKYKPELCCIH